MSQWYYVDGNRQRQGPVEDAALAALWRSGRIGLDTLVWREGEDAWRPLQDFRADLDVGSGALPPPLPEGVMEARPQVLTGAPPRSGLSGCMIAVIVAAVLLVPGTAILAAIALPAYQDYTLRAKIAAAVAAATPLKNAVAEHLVQHGRCPTDEDLASPLNSIRAQPHIANAQVGEFETNLCGIQLSLDTPGNAKVDGKALWLELDADAGRWQCSSEVEDRYLPSECRG